MNQDTLTRLDWVIEAVMKAPDRLFDMEHWENRRWLCGTTHCAIGWACQDERVQASGLVILGPRDDLEPVFEGEKNFDALARWLAISKEDAWQLFGPRRTSGKSRAEVVCRLKAYRAMVQHELERRGVIPKMPGEHREDESVAGGI